MRLLKYLQQVGTTGLWSIVLLLAALQESACHQQRVADEYEALLAYNMCLRVDYPVLEPWLYYELDSLNGLYARHDSTGNSDSVAFYAPSLRQGLTAEMMHVVTYFDEIRNLQDKLIAMRFPPQYVTNAQAVLDQSYLALNKVVEINDSEYISYQEAFSLIQTLRHELEACRDNLVLTIEQIEDEGR